MIRHSLIDNYADLSHIYNNLIKLVFFLPKGKKYYKFCEKKTLAYRIDFTRYTHPFFILTLIEDPA